MGVGLIHLFIDTNVYLKFYHYSNEDIEELKKLKIFIEERNLKLYLPAQVKDEFKRNRDNKLAEALKSFTSFSIINQFPHFFKGFNDFDDLKKAIEKFDKAKQKLSKEVMSKIETNTLEADKIIDSLFSVSANIESSEDLLKNAKLRYDLGNPPGKDKSYGDALNWESLIDAVPKGNDLYFISDDKDYFSKIDKTKFNTYLLDEWSEKKESKIRFYKTLSEFFINIIPNIKLATEVAKDSLISDLIGSGSFHNTRNVLRKLSKFDSFSSDQVLQIISAGTENNQLYWIINNEDINDMLFKIIDNNKGKIDKKSLLPLLIGLGECQNAETKTSIKDYIEYLGA